MSTMSTMLTMSTTSNPSTMSTMSTMSIMSFMSTNRKPAGKSGKKQKPLKAASSSMRIAGNGRYNLKKNGFCGILPFYNQRFVLRNKNTFILLPCPS
ncbi:MAG: hypothetical protein GY757_17080 [bacterium]|nr:hypothetical protein [bacterium]